jgi:multidrug resistance efflux pump
VIFIHDGAKASGLAPSHAAAHPEPRPRHVDPHARSSAGRALRILIGVGMLGLPIWFLTPGLWTISSSQAIVNAQVITLVSPIEGVVTQPPPPLGQLVSQGSVLLQIDAPLADLKYLDVLKTEVATAVARVAALSQHRARTEALKHDLEISFNKYKVSMVQRLEHELAEARSEAEAAEATLRQRESEEKEELAISRRSMGSQRELNQARFTSEVASRNAERTRTAVARFTDQLDSLKKGIFTGSSDSRNDVPYSRQRIDDLTVQLVDDEMRFQEEQAKLLRLRQQLETEAGQARQRSSYQLKAPADGIVWRHFVTQNSSVGTQTRLVQILIASSTFVDASLPEKYADDIRPGDKVVVRAMGSDLESPGTVRYLIGEEARVKDDTLAAASPEVGRHEVHVIVDLDQGLSGAIDFNQCFVGRRVEVRFPGITRSVLRVR